MPDPRTDCGRKEEEERGGRCERATENGRVGACRAHFFSLLFFARANNLNVRQLDYYALFETAQENF